MKIVLVGYMASGKSTIGSLLAKKKEVSFIDLDHYLEEKEEMTISEIFDKKGEIYFRKQEHFYLKEILNKKESMVLSLGGGTPCYAGNMDIISSFKNTVSVYLKASIPTIVERLLKEKNKRPLVSRLIEDELPEFVAKHLFERSYFYHQSKYKFSIDDKKLSVIIDQLNKLLG